MATMNFPLWWRLAGVPLLLLTLLFGLFYGLQLDFWLTAQWYALQGQQWLWPQAKLQAHGRLLLSLTLSLAGVALLKQLLPMQCPWDLPAFGGSQPFTPLFSSWPAEQAKIACFPAGHASVGFAWLALYFFCQQLYPALARPALWLAVVLGLVLGFTQQLRGAHFFSHDIASAAWCWSMACLVAYYADRTNTATAGSADGSGQAELAATCCRNQPQHIARRLS